MLDLTNKTQEELSQMYDQVTASIRNPTTSKDQAQALEKALILISDKIKDMNE